MATAAIFEGHAYLTAFRGPTPTVLIGVGEAVRHILPETVESFMGPSTTGFSQLVNKMAPNATSMAVLKEDCFMMFSVLS